EEGTSGPSILRCAANDAASAVVYALRCWKTGSAQDAAWAARRAYEALDTAVIERSGADMNAPGAEASVLSDPLIQAELARQMRDVEELRVAQQREFSSIVRSMRARARADARAVLQELLEISGLPLH